MGILHPHPLFLPKGTVRASLTLALSLTLLYHAELQNSIAQNFSTLVAVALSFYFGGRIRGGEPAKEKKTVGERAFGLPSGTVRSILIVLFVGYSAYRIYFNLNIPDYLLEVIFTIAGYIGGTIFRFIFSRKDKKDGPSLIDHLKSLLAIIVTGVAIWSSITVPEELITSQLISAAGIFLGFYFGSRD